VGHAQTIEYYHLDPLGSVRAVTAQDGQVVERHDYLPYGEEWCGTQTCGAPGGQPKHFTGKERDVETGLDYFGARHYGSKLGRFTTVDPVYTWQENLVDPQRWNRYAYAKNSPLRYIDPDGRVTVSAELRDKYPQAAKRIEAVQERTQIPTRRREAMAKHGHATDDQVAKAVTKGSGPEVRSAELDGNGRQVNGRSGALINRRTGARRPLNRIEIDNNVLEAYEKQWGGSQELLDSTVEHEIVHWLDHGSGTPPSRREVGKDYEVEIYGRDVGRDILVPRPTPRLPQQ
jgi:RHS repeat-associated protein